MPKNLEARKKRAYELHAQVAQGGKKAVESFLDVGVALKEIRDQKFYKELGYDNFESYTETEWGMSRPNAYKYIDVIEKLPAQIVSRVRHQDVEIPSLRRILALPFDNAEAFSKAISEEQLAEIARMSDPEFKTALDEMKKDRDGWQARYQKKYRETQLKDEKLATAEAELKDAFAKIDDLIRENSTLKAEEKDTGKLKLQQALDNLKVQYTEVQEKLAALEAEEMTMQQAKAVINRAFDLILEALFSLKKIKMCAALTPQLYGSYEMAKAMIDAEISYIVEHTDVTGGPFTIQDLAGEVEIHSLGGDIMQLEDETDEEYQQRYRALMKSFPRGGRKILSHRHPSGKKQPLFPAGDTGAKKEAEPE